MTKLDLLPRELLVRTSDVDHADWNYRPVLGFIQRARFRLIRSVLRTISGSSALEVGYGSGVFFPELRKHFTELSGIDPHRYPDEVASSLRDVGIEAILRCGSVTAMPFNTGSFDAVVAVSALEYVDDIDTACREIIRVLRPGGSLVLVSPGKSPLLDAGLKFLGDEDAWKNYGNRREALITALDRHFDVTTLRRWPWPGLPWFTVYRLLHLVPRR